MSGDDNANVDAAAPPRPAKSLGESAVSGVRSMGLTRVVAEAAGLISSVVLARLVSPAEFGRTAAAMFVAMLAIAIQLQGVGSFLVAHRTPTRGHFQAACLAALVAGAAGTAVTLAFALTAAAPIFGERAAFFVVLASPTWLLASLTAIPIAQLQRELSFGRLAVIQATASVVSPAVAIVLALGALEGEAIVIGAVAAVAVTAALGWIFSRPPMPSWRGSEMQEIVQFGVPTSASSILTAAIRNIDYLLLAAFVPAFQVGLYMRAFTLGIDYQSKISQVLLSVAFPVLSRARDRDEMRRVRARMIRVHTTVLFPLLFALIAIAPEFVPWMYGERWSGAAPLTQILAVGGMVAAVATGTGALLLAAGQPRALLVYNGVTFVAFTIAVLVAVPFGVTSVCVAVVAVRLIAFVVLQRAVVERAVGIPILDTVRDDVIPALTGGLPQLAVTVVGMRLGLDASLPTLVAMVLPGALGLAVYCLIVRALFPATWADMRRLAARLPVPTLTQALRRRIGTLGGRCSTDRVHPEQKPRTPGQ